MKFADRTWILATIFCLMSISPAYAGMTPGEVKFFEDCKAGAEKGSSWEQYRLGGCYFVGLGVAKDYVQAISWYRKSAEQGFAKAQYELGECLAKGIGLAKDDVQAVSWYRKAAESELAEAQSSLGFCYYFGKGVAKNEIEAYAYWSLAGTTDGDARKSLAILEKKMSADACLLGQQRTIELRKEIEMKKAGK